MTFGTPSKILNIDFLATRVFLEKIAGWAGFQSACGMPVIQIQFINHIIDHLTQNGVMEPRLLYESPYTDLNSQGVDGLSKGKRRRE